MRSLVILSFFLISCSFNNSVPEFLPDVYKMDIQQGNEIDSEMLLQLKPGMTKSQVRFVLGTPLIQDSFHNQRWDYIYEMRRGGVLIETRHVILNFEKDLLKNITGEVLPKNGKKSLINQKKLAKPSREQDKKNDDESSWIEKFKFWEEDTNITDEKNTNDKKNSNTEAGNIINKDGSSNNADFIQRIDLKESINEAVREDIESNESEDLSIDDLEDKKILSEDKEVIINQQVEKKESDYFKLLLEKIGF
jgi:outer membrane protein assembly factor BamE